MTMTTLRESLERTQAMAPTTTPPFVHYDETASQTGGPYVHIGLARGSISTRRHSAMC